MSKRGPSALARAVLVAVCAAVAGGARGVVAPTASERTAGGWGAEAIEGDEAGDGAAPARPSEITGERVTLDLVAEPDGVLEVTIARTGEDLVLDLWPHSVRGPDYQVLAADATGALVPAPPGPDRGLRGVVRDAPGSRVAGATTDDGLTALILLEDGRRLWIEPAAGRIPGAARGEHVLYEDADLPPAAGTCGNAGPDPAPWRRSGARAPAPDPRGASGGPGVLRCARLACDADYEYFQDYGSVGAVAARIDLVTNAVDLQYESQVGITHALGTIIVRTAEPDPYDADDPAELLCEFVTEWTANAQGIDFDLAKLFTGRTFVGPIVGLAAGIGEVCDRQGCCSCSPYGDDGAFCFSRNDCCADFACSTDLMAHELGHLWGAVHCDPCDTTMRSMIGCFNTFGPQAIADIIAHRDAAPCLDLGDCVTGPPVPPNDDCRNAVPISEGLTDFSTLGATTDGPAHASCALAGDGGQTVQDIWFTYVATCTGILRATTCTGLGGVADYDTDLVIYEGTDCDSLFLLGCNDDDPLHPCGGSPTYQSTVEVPVEAGNDYLVRVGGWRNLWDQGTGALNLTCTPVIAVCGNRIVEPGEECDPPDGVTCDGDCRFIARDNDFCAGAVALPCNFTMPLNNVSATPRQNDGGPGDPELPAGSPSCQFNGTPTDVHNTLWFAFTAADTSIDLQTCATTDVSDTILALYAGACGDLVELACGEDDCGPLAAPYRSRICYAGLTPGDRYLVMVGNPGSWSGSEAGAITLDLTCPCPDVGPRAGACCLCDGSCVARTPIQCLAAGGIFEGVGRKCATAPCTPCLGACCHPGGECLMQPEPECVIAGGRYEGDGSECEATRCGPPPCPADFDGSGDVGFADLLLLLEHWGPCRACPADLDGTGDVGFADILVFLAFWGPCV